MVEKFAKTPTPIELADKVNELVQEARAASPGGKALYTTTLPRSVYYDQATTFQQAGEESVTEVLSGTTDYYVYSNIPTGYQVVCNGCLYYIPAYHSYAYNESKKYYTSYLGKIFAISLQTGEVVDSLNYGVGVSDTSTRKDGVPIDIATNGTDKIWCWRAGILEEFNVDTKARSILSNSFLQGYTSTSSTTSITSYYYGLCGAFCYNPVTNKLYKFGGYGNGNASYPGTKTCLAYNLETAKTETLRAHPGSGAYGAKGVVIYIDPASGDIYFTNWVSRESNAYYRYNVATNTYTTIATNLGWISNFPPTVCPVGDVCYLFGGSHYSSVYCINPKTGGFLENIAVDSPLTGNYDLGGYAAAVYNNAIYSYARTIPLEGKGVLRKAEFFTEPPADAPVVAKIFKGQKYHALVPFSIERLGLEIKTTQQTAEEDITIKMYDYSAAGGQTIYIET